MSDRCINIKNIRPNIHNALIHDKMSEGELFQNATLRPIAKLQNPLLIAVFRDYIARRKNVFYDLPLEKQLVYIGNAIQKDLKLGSNLKGIFIGQFTVKEYLLYTQNASALNKRMMAIIKERLVSQIQLFKRPETL